MGQRLNIEIESAGKTLANCYYHWSGYTRSALELTKVIIHYLKDKEISKDVLGAIDLLTQTGAGLSRQAYDNAIAERLIAFEYKEAPIDRNEGLIGLY